MITGNENEVLKISQQVTLHLKKNYRNCSFRGLRGPPFLNKKNFVFRFFDFHFQRCIRVYSIRAVELEVCQVV
jgi:hypothetical protein